MRDQRKVNRAKTRYNAKHYDQVKIYVPAGGRAALQALAESQGLSMAEYVRHVIIADATRHGYEDAAAAMGGGGAAARLISLLRD